MEEWKNAFTFGKTPGGFPSLGVVSLYMYIVAWPVFSTPVYLNSQLILSNTVLFTSGLDLKKGAFCATGQWNSLLKAWV